LKKCCDISRLSPELKAAELRLLRVENHFSADSMRFFFEARPDLLNVLRQIAVNETGVEQLRALCLCPNWAAIMHHALRECDLFEGDFVWPSAGLARNLDCYNVENIHKIGTPSGPVVSIAFTGRSDRRLF
jgi:hypothetical protein